MTRIVVIGAGLSGLVSAIELATGGARVTLLNKGVGGLQLSQGTVDVLGYSPDRVARPFDALAELVEAHPDHPYATIGEDPVRRGIARMTELAGADLLTWNGEQNINLPTAVGAVRPTAGASPSMTAGACVDGARFVIVGLRELKDFHAKLVADNLTRTVLPDGGRLEARPVVVSLPARDGEADPSGLTYARALDDAAFRARLVALLKPHVREGETVGLPAVLGLQDHRAWREIQDALGHPIFEIPLPPPSVPGMRLNQALVAAAKRAGVRVVNGSRAVSHRVEGGRLASVSIATAGRIQEFPADAFVLATGGFESGALTLDSYGTVSETLLGLPLVIPDGDLVHGDYWGADQPLFKVGVAVGPDMRVVRPGTDEPVLDNVYAVGGILAGATRWSEKSGEGIALGSAVVAARSLLADPANPQQAHPQQEVTS